MAMGSELMGFSAWSLLSLTATADGVLAYPDEPGVRYVYDTTVLNGRYVAVGDLAVIRDNRYVFGAGWIDSIEESASTKIRYRCPHCRRAGFKYRSTRQLAYRCAKCGTEFNDNDRREEELTVRVFTANYSRTFRLADPPFSVKALDPAYIARSQQNAIRRLDPAALRPVLEQYLMPGEPWWETHVREDDGPPVLDADNRRSQRGGYLRPFKPRADSDYVTRVLGGPARRGRTHETLVNDFAEWLATRELVVGSNAAIDLGLEHPPVIIEVKVVRGGRWAHALREAIGQLYEYRYFQVVSPESSLIFLASTPIPKRWLDYLDHDREIGAAWRCDHGFELTTRARRTLGI
jgi:hypothetical protein